MWTATGVGEGYENHGGWDLLSSSVSRLPLSLATTFHRGPLCADVILRASLYLNIYLPKGIVAQALLPGTLCLAQVNFQGQPGPHNESKANPGS